VSSLPVPAPCAAGQNERNPGTDLRRDLAGERLRHGGEHARSGHDAGERAGSEEDASHQHGGSGVRVNPLPLVRRPGIVHDERDDGADHEDHDGVPDDPGDHHGQQHEGEHHVHPEDQVPSTASIWTPRWMAPLRDSRAG
jgi:hypothetical protein